MEEELTRNEKRAKRKQKKGKHKTSGSSVKLLQEIIVKRSKEASEEGDSVASKDK